jgi:hypothetical protein
MCRCGRRIRTTACLLLAASVALASGCADKDWIDRTLVTVDVTGTWKGDLVGPGRGATGSGGPISLDLKQIGARVTGHLRAPEYMVLSGPITGEVAGDVFSFRRGSLSGELTVNGDEMNGTAVGAAPYRVSLKRDDAPPSSTSPPR